MRLGSKVARSYGCASLAVTVNSCPVILVGGQWFSQLAPLLDNMTTPPPGTPTHMINMAGGNSYALGFYDANNESWSQFSANVRTDWGPNAYWMTGQFAGDRFMNIGWSMGGPPLMTDGAPYAIEDQFRRAKPAPVPVQRMMNDTDMPGGDISVTHHPANFTAAGCQRACDALAACVAWTWVTTCVLLVYS